MKKPDAKQWPTPDDISDPERRAAMIARSNAAAERLATFAAELAARTPSPAPAVHPSSLTPPCPSCGRRHNPPYLDGPCAKNAAAA